VVGLEDLVFTAQTEQNRVLEERWQHDVLVASLAGHLHAKVPWHECDECEGGRSAGPRVLVDEVLTGVLVECLDGIAEGASVANVLPGQSSERCAEWGDGGVDWLDQNTLMVEL